MVNILQKRRFLAVISQIEQECLECSVEK